MPAWRGTERPSLPRPPPQRPPYFGDVRQSATAQPPAHVPVQKPCTGRAGPGTVHLAWWIPGRVPEGDCRSVEGTGGLVLIVP